MTDFRESRVAPKYPSFPGKVEYGCLHQSVKGGPMDRVFIEPMDQAIVDVLKLRLDGVKAVLVHRQIPEWEQDEMSISELREFVAEAEEKTQKLREAYAEQLRLEEERRRQEDGELTWKEL
jgi:predicted RNase H-like nuclease (RuvC/YqgF family)